MKMRKILSFALALSLVAGSFSTAFAADPFTDLTAEDNGMAINTLVDLGVLNGYPDGTFKPEKSITRAEMSKVLLSTLGLKPYMGDVTSKFSDMKGHWSLGYVRYATDLGLIQGYPDGTFKPNKTVTYDEAATMLVRVLGYTDAALTGSWPGNYVNQASTLGIIAGIKGGNTGANRGDVATMNFQTLENQMVNVDKDGKITKLEDRNGKAIILVSKLGATLANADIIEGTESSKINLLPYTGMFASTFKDSKGNIIAINEVESNQIVGSYDAATGKFTDKNDVEYTISSALAATDAALFANGVRGADAKVNAQSDTFTINVDLSSKKIADVYSILTWNIDDAFAFEKEMAKEITDDQSLNGNNFVLDGKVIDEKSFALMGVNKLSDIKVDDVVYVYTNKDGIVRVEVGTEVVKGKVSKLSKDGAKVTVNGKIYQYASEELTNVIGADNINDAIAINDEVTLTLDYNGYIYTLDNADTALGGNYAILLDAAYGNTLNSQSMVKLFLADGTAKTYKVNNTEAKKQGMLTSTGWTATKTGIIVDFSVNKAGEVDYITTKAITQNDPTTPINGKLGATGYFNATKVNDNAPVFTFNGDMATGLTTDEDDYGVTTVAKIKDSTIKGYYISKDNKITAMVIEGTGSSDDKIFGVIDGFAKSSASSTTYQVTVFLADGSTKTYDISKSAYDSSTADDSLYMLKFDNAGIVVGLDNSQADKYSTAKAITVTSASIVIKNGKILSDDGLSDVSVVSNPVVYKYDAKDGFEKLSATSKNLSGASITLYDTTDDGNAVYNLIIIR